MSDYSDNNAPNVLEFDLDTFKAEFATSMAQSASYLFTRVRADEIRYCIWDGQDPDGRKHAANMNEAPFPWEGAADTRVRYVDDCVNEEVEFCLNAIKRSSIQAIPTTMGDQHEASIHAQVLQHTITSSLSDEWDREWEVALQWRGTYGNSCMGIYWRQETDTEEETVNLQQLAQIAQQDQNVADLLQEMMNHPDEEFTDAQLDSASKLLEMYFPGVKPKKAINDLQKRGEFTYEREYLKINRPSIHALRVLEDIFYPINTYALQESKWVVRRDILSVPEVYDRARVEEWDKDFLEKILRTKGQSILASTYYNTWRTRITQNVFVDEVYEKVEVFTAYTKEVDDKGRRKTWVTVFHPSIKEEGSRKLFEYEHGKFPFVDMPRERVTRSLIESRGIPELLEATQNEIKVQRDSRVDRTSLATIPPLFIPQNRGRQQIAIGPAVQIPVRQPGEYSWMNPPPMDSTTLEIEGSLTRDGKEFLGQAAEGMDPNKMVMRQQRIVDKTLVAVKEVCRQIHQLCQQYMSDQEVQAIVKLPNESMHASREDIQGEFNVEANFDAKDLNLDMLQAKLQMIATMLVPLDTAGSIDRAFLIKYAFQTIDPQFAAQGLKDVGSVTQTEITDEKNNLVQIANGIEPDMPESGVNFGLRMQVIQNTLQQSPAYGKEIMQDPDKQKLLENRMKYLKFQMQQQQNAQIGRIGTSPIQQGA